MENMAVQFYGETHQVRQALGAARFAELCHGVECNTIPGHQSAAFCREATQTL